MKHLVPISLLVVFLGIAGYATLTGRLCEISLPIVGELRIKCSESEGATEETFTVSAKNPWQNTGVRVRIGDKIKINASGEWSAIDCRYHYAKKHPLCTSNTGILHDADGIEDAIRSYQVNGANLGALVAKIGSDVFLIGSEHKSVIKTDGFLELGIEDCYENKGEGSCLSDNDGTITAKISASY